MNNKFSLNYLHLADAATVDNLGKISVLGIFGKIFLNKVPEKFLKFTIIGSIAVDKTVKDKIEVAIKFFGPSREELKIDREISLSFPLPTGEAKENINFLVDIGNLEFKEFGPHEVLIYANGEKVGFAKFSVEKRGDK